MKKSKQRGRPALEPKQITVVWEHVVDEDSKEMLALAYEMMFSNLPTEEEAKANPKSSIEHLTDLL